MESGYDLIADEYYSSKLHPTCSNFRSLSQAWVERVIVSRNCSLDSCLEVGAGHSILAELRKAGALKGARKIVLQDRSEGMLRHSQHLAEYVDSVLISDICDSEKTAREAGRTFDFILASLADSYNSGAFWETVRLLLNREGTICLTTPSYEWSRLFRLASQKNRLHVADFVTRHGDKVSVPSTIYPVEEQKRICEQLGFRINSVEQLYADILPPEELSDKLRGVVSKNLPAVTGYVVTLT